MWARFTSHLYVRIWLAVVATVIVLTLMVGAAWYLAITSVLSAIQYLVERGLARSERRSAVNNARSSRLNQPARQPQPQEAVHAQLS